MTDERGTFRLLALPPGEYTIVAELDGFHVVEQANVRVPLDGSVVLDLSLTPGFEEKITVAEVAPVIDATSATRGVELSREVFEVLPNARSTGLTVNASTEGANTLANLAPSVVPDHAGAPRFAGHGIHGNQYLVDGLDVTDPHRRMAGVGFPFEFVDEVEIKTGGYGAEYGGAVGGVINVLTRSGGNQHRGEVFGYYRDQDTQAGPFGDEGGFREQDYGVDAGGRLVRDRLWYFVALNPQSVETEIRSVQGRSLTETPRGRAVCRQAHLAAVRGPAPQPVGVRKAIRPGPIQPGSHRPPGGSARARRPLSLPGLGRNLRLALAGGGGGGALRGRGEPQDSGRLGPRLPRLNPRLGLGVATGLRRHLSAAGGGSDLVHADLRRWR